MIKRFYKPDMYISLRARGEFGVITERVEAPVFMRGVRIALVTDVHVRRGLSDAELNDMLVRIASLNADVIALTGDMADRREQQRRFLSAFQAVFAGVPAFASVGNNDLQAYNDNVTTMREDYAKAGIRLLVNEAVRLPVNGGTLAIAGVDDLKYGTPDASRLFEHNADEYRVLLSHHPYTPDYGAGARAHLQLSGHTHGGQVNILGVTPYLLGFERGAYPIIRGRASIGGTELIVSPGLGESKLMLRIGIKPEVYVVEFNK